VRLALGKRVLTAATTTAEGNPPPQATTSAVGPAGGHQAEPEAMSEGEGESHGTDCTGSEGPPLTSSGIQSTSPRSGAEALEPSEAPAAQQPDGSPSVKTTATVPGGKKKSRAARRAARAALEANGGPPAADGDQAPLSGKPQQCQVFSCTREHAPGDCPTFLDMTPKERLDLVHAKQLCLLCLQHPLSVGCRRRVLLPGEGLR
jgi:hypothetical protein